MNYNKITFILPIKGNYDILLAFNILIPSILKYFKLEDLEDFFIISTNDEYELINKYIHNTNASLKLKCINENTIIQDMNSFNKMLGCRKQQILKLEMAKFCTTDIYLTLDSDMFLIKHVSINDFLINNKIIYNYENYDIHKYWWIDSCKLLKYDFESIKNKLTFGVTPSILIKSVVLELFNYLNIKNYNIFSNKNHVHWTEYTLYWSYVIKNNYDVYYMSDNEYKYKYKLYSNSCIWFQETLQKKLQNNKQLVDIYYDIIKNSSESTGVFAIIQSTTRAFSNEEEVIKISKLFT